MLSIKLKFYVLLFLVISALMALAIYVDNRIIENYKADLKSSTQTKLTLIENRLSSHLYNNIHVAKGVPVLFALNPNLAIEDYQRAVKPLFEVENQIRNIAAAPDMIIKYMYPLEGNEAAIGLDYRKVPDQFDAVNRAKKLNSVLVAGPITLKQGGVGFITRFPLYLTEPQGQKTFWGMISAVIDAQALYQVSGLFNPDLPIDIAIRGRDGLGSKGDVFFGDESLFEQAHLSTTITLPIGSWEMVARPKMGWETLPDAIWQRRLFSLIIVLIIFSFIASYSKAIMTKYQVNDKFRKLIEHSPIAYMLTNGESKITYLNKAFTDTYGYTLDDLSNENHWLEKAFPQEAYRETVKKEWANYLEQFKQSTKTPDPIEFTITAKDGSKRIAQVSLTTDFPDKVDYPVVLYDITETKEYQRSLEMMAHYDVLTQLPNRILLIDRFKQAIAHAERSNTLLAVCFLDIDDFKPVNDGYGHDVGDQLLIAISKSLKSSIRNEDTVARIGGDEFILLLGDLASLSDYEQLIARLQNELMRPYTVDNHTMTISASCGVTLYPNDRADLDTLIRHADQAMYQAKLLGKNRYQLFNTAQDKAIFDKQQRINEIEQALKQDQFRLYYQPKVDMKTGQIFGVEALIRWEHPEKGILSPLEFLPLIDGSILEIKIGNWVLETALEQIERWNKINIELEVSVNISSYHLQSSNFLSDLKHVLAKYKNTPSQLLQLEILESSALSDLSTISNIIRTCRRKLGLHIALDDFGTGYSSLTHMRNLDANTIKIDRSFVRDVLDDPNDYSIIDGIIGLANSFNRHVIAEGVESSEHGEILILMGCYQAQGYTIAHPMPPENLLQWLDSYQVNQQWITLANKDFTNLQKYLSLLQLTLNQWVSVFEKSIKSSTENLKNLPNMERTSCHHTIWLKRLLTNNQIDRDFVNRLENKVDKIHGLAQEVIDLHQQDDVEHAYIKLNELIRVRANISKLIQQTNLL